MDDSLRLRPGPAAWVTLALALGLVLVLVGRVLLPFFAVILLGLVTCGLLYRPFERLTARLGGRRVLAAAALCVGLVLAVVAPLVWTAVAVSNEAVGFYQITVTRVREGQLEELFADRQESFEEVNRVLGPFGVALSADKAQRWLATQGVKLGAFFYTRGLDIAGGLVRLLVGFLLWILVVYYLLVDGPLLREWLVSFLPVPAEQVGFLSRRFTDMAGSLVLGNGLAGVIQGVGGGLTFALLDLPAPVMWGVVMAILAFIPVIGISCVYIPGAIILWLAGDTSRALLMLVPLAILATVVEYWLKPLFVGRRAHMHPLLVALALLGGFQAFGPMGLLVGPLTMMVFLALAEIFRHDYRPAMQPEVPGATGEDGLSGAVSAQQSAPPPDPPSAGPDGDR